jgi:hypothetical protein
MEGSMLNVGIIAIALLPAAMVSQANTTQSTPNTLKLAADGSRPAARVSDLGKSS